MRKTLVCKAWVALFVVVTGLVVPWTLSGQGLGRGGGFYDVPNLSASEAREVLERFRGLGLANDFSFLFELRHLPRRGAEQRREGRLWGTFTPEGPRTLFEIFPEEGETGSIFLLVANGREPRLWVARGADQDLEELGVADFVQPLVPGFGYTAFDAMMPFIFWPEAEYRESRRILGRRAHLYRMHPPEGFREQVPWLGRVEMALDYQFDALLQVRTMDAESGEAIRSFSVLAFNRVGEETIVGQVELRDLVTRDRTIFQVTGAVMNVLFPEEVFEGGHPPMIPQIEFEQYQPLR